MATSEDRLVQNGIGHFVKLASAIIAGGGAAGILWAGLTFVFDGRYARAEDLRKAKEEIVGEIRAVREAVVGLRASVAAVHPEVAPGALHEKGRPAPGAADLSKE